MIPNLLDLVKGEFSSDLVGKIAGSLGESSQSTMGAIGAAAPALLAGLLNKGSTTQGANDILGLLRQGGFDSRGVNLASALAGGGDGLSNLVKMGAPLLGSIFGGRSNNVTDWLSSQAGVGRASASSILGLLTPVLLSTIGRQLMSSGGLNASGLMSLLAGQRSFLQSAAPPGLAGALGLGSLADLGGTVTRAAADPQRSSPWRWLIPLLALILLIPLLRSRCAPERTPVATTPETAPPPAEPAPAPRLVEQNIPGGARLMVAEDGIEKRLVGFIEDKGRPVDETTWFTFDRLEFDTDSATLRPSSQEQLRNIAAILAAYPGVEVKIGGYTDNVGDDAHNVKLSQDRARSTMQALIDLGVSASRITAEGYGKEHPVADNATPEGRQRNRRIDVRVTKK
jgi:outer membrane protein OmpA-like peptidoglycan-associated protein